MNTSNKDLETHFQFQLSLLKLITTQHSSERVSTLPTIEIAQQEHLLQDAIARNADSIQ